MLLRLTAVPTCSVEGELCCARNTSAEYNNVWSLQLHNRDNLLTRDFNEVKQLLAQGWVEVCNPFPVRGFRNFLQPSGSTTFLCIFHPQPRPVQQGAVSLVCKSSPGG